MTEAYQSALDLSFDVRAGLVMRQIHHWAALLFLAAIVVHLMRIFFTGAFRRPREINWIIGVTLLILAIFNGFAGYSLLDDQLSGTGLRIAYSIALSIPLAGTWLASLLFGGEFPGPDIINRLFVIHILLIPARDRRAPRRPPRRSSCARSTPSSAGPGRTRGQRRRRAGVAELTPSKAIGLFFSPPSVLCRAGRPGPDQPGLALRAVRPGRGELGVAARLVHGLARRRAAAHARLGDPRVRLRDPRTRSSRRSLLAGHHVHRCCTPGRSSRRGSPATTTDHHLLDRPRDAAVCAPRSAWRRSTFYAVLTFAASSAT